MVNASSVPGKLKETGFHVETFPFSYEMPSAALYNQQVYLEKNDGNGLVRFIQTRGSDVLIQTYLYAGDGRAENARFSGFGGIEFLEEAAPFLDDFIKAVESWCRGHGVQEIMFKLPPWIYVPRLPFLEDALAQNGYSVRFNEINQHIQVSSAALAGRMEPDEKRRLRRCYEAGFQFRQLNADDLPLAYELIERNHRRRGFPVTMTLEGLGKMFRYFPGSYLLFGVFDGDRLVATAVSIRVNPRVLYNFYHGSHEDYQHLSPIVMVIEGVYQYCQKLGYSYLDIGISSVKGKWNEGLYRFKKNCGCEDADKKLFYKAL